jgi:hypothetical protein
MLFARFFRDRKGGVAPFHAGTSGDPTSTLLKNCAGSPGKYPDADKLFLLTSASAIITTFADRQLALEPTGREIKFERA